MAKIYITDRSGTETEVTVEEGTSIMEAARDNSVGDIMALCGGCCACATCHVYIEGEWAAKVGGPGDTESILLESSCHMMPNSRLGCQVQITSQLDGLRITVAPEN